MFYLKNQYLTLFSDIASIRKRLHNGLVFTEFDRNLNFISDDILPDFLHA
jgi:hypothetical protein